MTTARHFRIGSPGALGLLACSLLLLGAARPDPAKEYLAREHRSAAGSVLPYRFLVPPEAKALARDPKTLFPLVLFLHGAGERGSDNLAQLRHGLALYLEPENRTRFPCFVVAPQCPAGNRWAPLGLKASDAKQPDAKEPEAKQPDVKQPETKQPEAKDPVPAGVLPQVLELLDEIRRENPVDPDRIYVTGLSMGGHGTWALVESVPGRFAAAAPICGRGDPARIGAESARLPIWAFHSEDDPTVKVDGTRDLVKALRAAGGKPHYSEYVGLGHDSWSAAYSEPEFLPWLFSQRLGRADAYPLRIESPELPPVARFPADEAFPGKGPIRKMDWFRNLWRERRLAWWKSRDRDRGAVVFLGDSITQGWDSLAKDFPGLKTANRGISGDVTRGVLCRLRGDVLDLDPRLVVILLGTNDIEEGAAPETLTANLSAILDAIEAHEPPCPVVVCEIFPSHASMSRPAETIRRSNALLCEAVRGRPRTTLLETYALFADPDGNAKREEFPDLLHPNAAGYAKWAEALRGAFVKLGMDPRGGSGGETK